MTTRMSQLPQFAIFYLAAAHLLFSICPVSSRIYRTKDAVVIEVDDLLGASSNLAAPSPSTRRSARSTFAGTAMNPYSAGLYYHQKQPLQPNFISWWYPHLYKPISTSSYLIQNSPEFKQSNNIACGVGPSLPGLMQRTIPSSDSSPDRIFGGIGLAVSLWPFMVGLKKSSNSPVFCGGTLISPTRVLTAAHCVDRLSVSEISTLTASFGMNFQMFSNTPISDALLTRRVVRVIYHLEYNRKSKENDIAILTIDPPISYLTTVSPVCLPSASDFVDQFAGKKATIMGWGPFSETSGVALNLQTSDVTIITNSQCNAMTIDKLGFSITNRHICARDPKVNPCQNDGGGPMVVQTSPRSWTQVGIIGIIPPGTPCKANPDTPSVYTNVAFFRDWIDQYATPQYFIKIPTIQNLMGNNYK